MNFWRISLIKHLTANIFLFLFFKHFSVAGFVLLLHCRILKLYSFFSFFEDKERGYTLSLEEKEMWNLENSFPLPIVKIELSLIAF